MYGPVAKLRISPTINDCCCWEGGNQRIEDTILLHDIREDDEASGNVLDLGQTDTLTLKLRNDGSR